MEGYFKPLYPRDTETRQSLKEVYDKYLGTTGYEINKVELTMLNIDFYITEVKEHNMLILSTLGMSDVAFQDVKEHQSPYIELALPLLLPKEDEMSEVIYNAIVSSFVNYMEFLINNLHQQDLRLNFGDAISVEPELFGNKPFLLASDQIVFQNEILKCYAPKKEVDILTLIPVYESELMYFGEKPKDFFDLMNKYPPYYALNVIRPNILSEGSK